MEEHTVEHLKESKKKKNTKRKRVYFYLFKIFKHKEKLV